MATALSRSLAAMAALVLTLGSIAAMTAACDPAVIAVGAPAPLELA